MFINTTMGLLIGPFLPKPICKGTKKYILKKAHSDGSSKTFKQLFNKTVDYKVVSGFQYCLEKFFSCIPKNVKNAGSAKI